MIEFEQKYSQWINGFEINAYTVDTKFNQALKDLLKNKIKKIKLYTEDYIDFLSPDTDPKFKTKMYEKIVELSLPSNHKIKWFDVKRSFTTEFMSQILLEKNYNCIFHNEADKRINTTPINVDKHADGIDVVGIKSQGETFNFVVCEVKASKDNNIPCSSSASLLDDIKKSSTPNSKRLQREILQYMKNIGSVNTQTTEQAVKFLSELLVVESSENKLFESIIFYPFLIRDNNEIINNGNLNDFQDFKKEELSDIQLTGIIWSFNENIDDFCINLYDEAIGELNNDN
ncbi:hypothetical protein ACN09M_09905 [Aliarcobacter butzleri]|jgi:hypothetical protein|uniref:hypothetical protein n=1 Tax=Aliarcobacter butzleri TaxID=28197 RepID=UPI001EDEBB14|nr:hypothetical protein [Aliarcobacter butzleri]MCG3695471.1 hypothetical protein [Aliarcobacter butzleri]